MSKPSFTVILVTAFLMPVTNGIAWSDDALSTVDTTAATQRQQLPAREPAPVRYPPPPPPNQGWQAGPWGSPPAWAVPPRGYRQPSPAYRADLEFIRLQEELAANRAELDKARKDLRQSETEMQEARTELDRAHSEHHRNLDLQHALSEKLAAATANNVVLQAHVTQLTTELATANTSLSDRDRDRQQVATLTDERDQLQNTLARNDEQLATLKDELQTATTELQQAKSGMETSRRELAESQAQARTYKNRLDNLNARLEDQQQAMLHAKQLLAEMNSARDSLRTDLSASTEELTRVQATLEKAQAQAEQLRQARSNSPIAESPEQPVPAESDAPVPDAVEVAAMESADTAVQVQTEDTPTETGAEPVVVASAVAVHSGAADTDRDSVPDSIDLCPGTADSVAVESTGCAVNAIIPLEGVNFRYNSHELTDDARLVLDRIADILNRNTDIRLEVAGHTDSQGDAAYNQWLSQQRAQTVRGYLITRGLDPENIAARGYGARQPLAENTTVDGLVRNRRVELHSLP